MKILIINQHISDSLGGSEIQCDLIARGLKNKGYSVIYCAVGKKRKNKYYNFSYKIIPLAIEKNNELFKLLKKKRPDIIYWRYNKKYLLSAVKQSKKLNIPFVFAVSHINDTKKYAHKEILTTLNIKKISLYLLKKIKNQIKSRWNYKAFKNIDAVTVLNSQFLNQLPVKNQKMIRNGIAFSNKTNFYWPKPYFTWVANIKKSKQPGLYIKLASMLYVKYPNIDFLMIGAIQDKDYISIIQKANKNSKNFHYLGIKKPEEINGILANSISLIHTCKPEGFPNNFIQAWTQGCPTISLEFDPDNLIKSKKLGFISNNFKQMIKDTEEIILNKSLRNKISKKAQDFSKKNFNSRLMIDKIEKIILETIKENVDK